VIALLLALACGLALAVAESVSPWPSIPAFTAAVGVVMLAALVISEYRERRRLEKQRAYQREMYRRHGVWVPLGWKLDVLRSTSRDDWGWPEVEW
jgi:membrane protein YdbS with pleckstrin-like domain